MAKNKQIYELICVREVIRKEFSSKGILHVGLRYPFQNYTLKDIVDLSDRVKTFESNHGHSSRMIVNERLVSNDNNNVYVSLLSYISFLNVQIEDYYAGYNKMSKLELCYPDVYDYIARVMDKINECIDDYVKKGVRPFPASVREYLGQEDSSYDHQLYYIINLLLAQKGAKVIGGYDHYKELETVKKDETNLSEKASDLFEILKVSDEEVNERRIRNKTFGLKDIDLDSYLQEIKNKDNGPKLIK